MGKKISSNTFFEGVVAANEGITVKDVKSIFVWYDLLSYALPFQLIFILVYAIGSADYVFTMISVLCIFVTDSAIKYALEKDAKNYVKLHKYVSLVKLWVIPLMFIGLATTVSLVVTTFGII